MRISSPLPFRPSLATTPATPKQSVRSFPSHSARKPPSPLATPPSSSPPFSVAASSQGVEFTLPSSTYNSPGFTTTTFPGLSSPVWREHTPESTTRESARWSWSANEAEKRGTERCADEDLDVDSEFEKSGSGSEGASASSGSATRRSSAATTASSVDIEHDPSAPLPTRDTSSASPHSFASAAGNDQTSFATPTAVVKSSLVPTATPFVFQPRPSPSLTTTPSSFRPILPIFQSSQRSTPPSSEASFVAPPSPFGNEPYTPPQSLQNDLNVNLNRRSWTFGQGAIRTVDADGAPGYFGALGSSNEMVRSQSQRERQTSGGPRFRQTSIPIDSDDFAPRIINSFNGLQSTSSPRPQIPQGAYPPTPPLYSSDLNYSVQSHSRTPSFNGSPSYFSAHALPTQDRSPTTAQLSAYFGASPAVDVVSPDSRLAFDEDSLYLLARQTFVQQSLLTFPSQSPSVSQQQAAAGAMMAHFDRAMSTPSPLASLYGITIDAAERLLEEPEKSGVGEPVLALVRSRFERISRGETVAGPSANNRKLGLYKTELCRSWEEKGNCRYGTKCQFAHGIQEIREVPRHPKFKSEVCRTFWLNGSCPYGRRCCFIHATLPESGAGPTPDSLSAPRDNPLAAVPLESPNLSDSAPAPVSRLAQRMSASSSAERGLGPFGPALATYLGPNGSNDPNSNSFSAPTQSYRSGAMYQDGPRENLRDVSTGGGLYGVSFEQTAAAPSSRAAVNNAGLGCKLPGRFTNNPTEVPPTFQDPPQSRLSRLAQLPPQRHSDRIDSMYPYPSNALMSMGIAARNIGSVALSRHPSNASTSSSGGTTYSPLLLPRQGSSSSVSSVGPPSNANAAFSLQRAGNEWLAGSASGSLEWSAAPASEEDLDFDFQNQSHTSFSQNQYDQQHQLQQQNAIDRRFGAMSLDHSFDGHQQSLPSRSSNYIPMNDSFPRRR